MRRLQIADPMPPITPQDSTARQAITQREFQLLRDYIEESCGIALGDGKDYLVESRLSGLSAKMGCNSLGELHALATSKSHLGLRDKIVDAMTTNETLWFRDGHAFEALKHKILPEFEEKAKSRAQVAFRIWSAGCSTGQEPYSIAMVVDDYCRSSRYLQPEMVEILATDISPSALYLAMNAKYDHIAMSRGLPDHLKTRYFAQEGNVYAIAGKIRSMVSFKLFNLQNDFRPLGPQDVVMLRYVAIYFSEDFKKDLFAKITDIINHRGFLFLGGSEATSRHASQFEMLEHQNGLYYRKRG